MIKPICDFANLFKTSIGLDENLVVKEQNRYFLLTDTLRKLTPRRFFYVGAYLGKTVKGKFFPSLELLRMIAEKKANKVVVDKKAEWLFICGRDVFRRGIIEVVGSSEKGDYVLVLNRRGECLGYGRAMHDLRQGKERIAIKNVIDIGDFLRREREEL
jgi:ribosome biogenesis protein Nip4